MILSGKVKKNMDLAVKLIKEGGVVAFPTETVYGLGAGVFDENAISKIYEAKGRPFEDPLIVHIADKEQISELAEPLEGEAKIWADRLIKKFWPGPLTLIFKKKKTVPAKVTGGLDTVAVRMPRHLIARALIKNCGFPIAAPSANRFQSLSPTTAEAVSKELGDRIPLILDGGPCEIGLESTVLSLAGAKPAILRPGGVSQEDIEEALGFAIGVAAAGSKKGPLLSPGLMEFHYAPRKPLELFEAAGLKERIRNKKISKSLPGIALLCFSRDEEKMFSRAGFYKIYVLSPRGNLNQAGKELYAVLRAIDEDGSKAIYALKCPDERLGRALNDRLTKARH